MYNKIPVLRDRQCKGEGSKSKNIDMPEKKMKKATFMFAMRRGWAVCRIRRASRWLLSVSVERGVKETKEGLLT